MSLTPHRYTSLRTQLGECPVWDEDKQALYVMDCRIGLIHKIHADLRINSFSIPAPAGSLSLNQDGQLIVALKEHIALFDPENNSLKMLERIEESDMHVRLNDGTTLKDGSFIVGTMHSRQNTTTPLLGGIYRLFPSGKIQKIAQDIGVANGLCTNPIDHRFYLCDSSQKSIFSYSFDSNGLLTDRKLFANTDAYHSAPDGCAFDEEGGLWTVLVHQGEILRFNLQGNVTHRIAIPAQHPSALCFGGPSGEHIYITSISKSDRLSAHSDLDGAVFCIPNSGFKGATIAKGQLRSFSSTDW